MGKGWKERKWFGQDRERERALNAGLTIESATFVKDNVSLASQGP